MSFVDASSYIFNATKVLLCKSYQKQLERGNYRLGAAYLSLIQDKKKLKS
jgi:hypothetical protein